MLLLCQAMPVESGFYKGNRTNPTKFFELFLIRALLRSHFVRRSLIKKQSLMLTPFK